jgi:hypothetical protein
MKLPTRYETHASHAERRFVSARARSMLEARVVSPIGSLYFAAEATPYDLENLRMHIRDLMPRAGDGRVEVRVTARDSVVGLSAWLRQLAGAGVHVTRVRRAIAS